MVLPGHVLEVHLSQIAKVAQITHPGNRKKGTGWEKADGLQFVVGARPRLFSALWPRQTERELPDGWGSCEETLQGALASLHLHAPPWITQGYWDVKSPF